VSIVSENAFLCDILATAVFVLGKEDGLTLIEGIEGVEAIVVTKEGISSTSGVGERLLTTR
jgi:thiamine biosynthesis lipoprotein